MEQLDDEVTLSTTAAIARIFLNPLRVRFTDASGRGFAADDEELGMGTIVTPDADVFSEPLGSSGEPGQALQEARDRRAVLRVRREDQRPREDGHVPGLLERRPSPRPHRLL